MKVLCIDATPVCLPKAILKNGSVYTASQCPVYPDNYDLAELPINPFSGYIISFLKRRFIPLSDIDETEMIRNYQTVSI